MKKYVALLFTAVIFIFNTQIINFTASAKSERYLRVVEKNVYMYSDSTFTNKIFEIPYSYYVKVESVQNNVVKASYGPEGEEFPLIIGYLKYEELLEVDYLPINPYSTIKVSAYCSDVLFNDANLKKAYFNVTENTFMIYYGKFIKDNGAEISYVYCNNKLGYFDLNSLNPFSIPNHQNPIEELNPTVDEPINDDIDKSEISSLPAENLQVIIIIGLSIICIAIVYALFKPPKQKQLDGDN